MQTLSFRATDIVSNQEKYPEIDKNNIVDVNGTRLLKTVGIYGANASGKSNVVRAFLDFCKVVGALQQPSGEILKDLAQPFLYNRLYLEKFCMQLTLSFSDTLHLFFAPYRRVCGSK